MDNVHYSTTVEVNVSARRHYMRHAQVVNSEYNLWTHFAFTVRAIMRLSLFVAFRSLERIDAKNERERDKNHEEVET